MILHQDPRRQVTLTQAGDILLFDQYKITPPYTDGMAQDAHESYIGAGCSGLFSVSSDQKNCYMCKNLYCSGEVGLTIGQFGSRNMDS